MEVMYNVCCGVDVHKKLIVACLYRGKKKELREFGTTTKELLSCKDWLDENKCQMVAMESTGVYWKPLYNILEASEIGVIIVNASHMKNVPGKKTDITDAEWIGDLLRHGLLNASYIPSRSQRELREIVTYRKKLSEMKSSEMNRYQKTLEGGNIKLSGFISNITGLSAKVLMGKVTNGEFISEEDIVEMRKSGEIACNLKSSPKELAEALNGVLSRTQRELLNKIMRHIEYLEAEINDLDNTISGMLNEEEDEAVELLVQIPGINERSAQAIVAVLGTSLDQFPNERKMAAWAGLCPGNNESAKKRHSGRTTHGNVLLKTTMTVCANSAVRAKDSFFAAQYNRLIGRKGRKKTIIAVAHSMLIAIYHVLKYKVPYRDLGFDYYTELNKEHKLKSLLKQIEKLGFEVAITTLETA